MTEVKKKAISATIRADLADRLAKEAEARMIGQSLLVERGVERLLNELPPIDLPAPPVERPIPDAKAAT